MHRVCKIHFKYTIITSTCKSANQFAVISLQIFRHPFRAGHVAKTRAPLIAFLRYRSPASSAATTARLPPPPKKHPRIAASRAPPPPPSSRGCCTDVCVPGERGELTSMWPRCCQRYVAKFNQGRKYRRRAGGGIRKLSPLSLLSLSSLSPLSLLPSPFPSSLSSFSSFSSLLSLSSLSPL